MRPRRLPSPVGVGGLSSTDSNGPPLSARSTVIAGGSVAAPIARWETSSTWGRAAAYRAAVSLTTWSVMR